MLTREERDGLEEVFMSIHSKKSLYNIIKHYNIMLKNSAKQAKIGTKMQEIYKFLSIFSKKKKNLSK
ncbi:hypothetical protein [Sulfurimonas sp.]|uniref:hypothetical protein n=1 Tax=Sulfurimonas sp. TaxID=2022749 RepID=UPI00356585E3